jgi:rhodanese-related sulfurtransferase
MQAGDLNHRERYQVKFLLDNWMLISVALASGFMLFLPQLQSASGISAAEAVNLINREKALLVDVSEANEFANQRCSGSVNLPFGQLEEKIATVAKNKSLPVVLVCPTGARAKRAVGLLKKLGYENVQALNGGTKSWADANYPVEKAA